MEETESTLDCQLYVKDLDRGDPSRQSGKTNPKGPAEDKVSRTHSKATKSKKETTFGASKHRNQKAEPAGIKSTSLSEASDNASDGDSDSSSTDSESDEDDSEKRSQKKNKTDRRKAHAASKNRKRAAKGKKRKGQKAEDPDDSTDSDSASTTDVNTVKRRGSGRAHKSVDFAKRNLEDRIQVLESYLSQLSAQGTQASLGNNGFNSLGFGLPNPLSPPPLPPAISITSRRPPPVPRGPGRPRNRRLDRPGADTELADEVPTKPDYKRVDWIWDTSQYCYKLQNTAKTAPDTQYEGYIFHVRRTFDHEGKYLKTFVDVKSKLLRECLQDVIKDVQGISLVDETPKLDPNLLFLYVEDLRNHYRGLKDLEPAGETSKARRKNQKRLNDKRKHLRVLLRYLDKDYENIKNSLYPMLDSGLITYDLLWALWKPGTMVYSLTYGNQETPRVFKVDTADRHRNIMKGDFYYIDGKYIEYDGKRFGYGSLGVEVAEFRGARKITSLPCYPISYCKDEARVRKELVERGKKFVKLSGVHFKTYTGMAFMKRKKSVLRFNLTNSRIMVDPAIFRRTNPNYYVSHVKPKNHDVLTLSGDSSDGDSDACCGCDSSGDADGSDDEKTTYVTKVCTDQKGNVRVLRAVKGHSSDEENEEALGEIPSQESGRNAADEEVDILKGDADDTAKTSTPKSSEDGEDASPVASQTAQGTPPEIDTDKREEQKLDVPLFTEDEYLIASPLVLGFSFGEKQWLEFDVALVQDIKWNENAWESLVLEPETKDLIKALVESRKFNAATKVDDVIQGKGKGLVTVLHGPPGTGKTLTAEGISELLQCPLYMASAGELGTDSRFLEHELQKILDICHTWGAILLLDEADVFLEKRNMQDIHRNALVSIFLRQLEYFQGILFLTTNRVETFDEAFQSRIHVALRYDKLDGKAKRAIFKLFLERVRTFGKMQVKHFAEADITALAKHDLNGREIKNVMGSAQDLAVNKGEALSMRHIKLVLDVHAKFGRDLKGGTGFEDAMRSYF